MRCACVFFLGDFSIQYCAVRKRKGWRNSEKLAGNKKKLKLAKADEEARLAQAEVDSKQAALDALERPEEAAPAAEADAGTPASSGGGSSSSSSSGSSSASSSSSGGKKKKKKKKNKKSQKGAKGRAKAAKKAKKDRKKAEKERKKAAKAAKAEREKAAEARKADAAAAKAKRTADAAGAALAKFAQSHLEKVLAAEAELSLLIVDPCCFTCFCECFVFAPLQFRFVSAGLGGMLMRAHAAGFSLAGFLEPVLQVSKLSVIITVISHQVFGT